VTGGYRILYNEELRNLYYSPSENRTIKSRRMRCAGMVAGMREERNMCGLLIGKKEGKRPLGKPRRKWLDNFEMDLAELVVMLCTGLTWLGIRESVQLLLMRQ
jgi:hypothetical protein